MNVFPHSLQLYGVYVSFQITTLGECLSTLLATIGLFFCMSSHVSCQVVTSGECFSTLLAPGWLLSCVNSRVSSQVTTLGEALSTCLATVRLHHVCAFPTGYYTERTFHTFLALASCFCWISRAASRVQDVSRHFCVGLRFKQGWFKICHDSYHQVAPGCVESALLAHNYETASNNPVQAATRQTTTDKEEFLLYLLWGTKPAKEKNSPPPMHCFCSSTVIGESPCDTSCWTLRRVQFDT